MQFVGIGRPKQILHRIRAIGLDPNSVDHKRVALVMADGISVPGRFERGRVGGVHAHPAQFMVTAIQHEDPVRLLYHLHLELLENERHRMGPTLIRRIGIGNAGQRHFAQSLYHRCRPGLQDRAFVIPNQLVVIADTDLARRQPRRTGGARGPLLRPARQVGYRARTRCRRLEPGKDRMTPDAGKIRNRGRAVRVA